MIRIFWLAILVTLLCTCKNTSKTPDVKPVESAPEQLHLSALNPDMSPCYFLPPEKMATLVREDQNKITIKEKALSKSHKTCIALWLVDSLRQLSKTGSYLHQKETAEIHYDIMLGRYRSENWAMEHIVDMMAGSVSDESWHQLDLEGVRAYWHEGESQLIFARNNNIHKFLILVPLSADDRIELATALAGDVLSQI